MRAACMTLLLTGLPAVPSFGVSTLTTMREVFQVDVGG
jgi:hypothetical protein